jgi:uncharacterized protein involved in exopolysaccharide biosynthesis/Mrp family chromosome partitioning ATPase
MSAVRGDSDSLRRLDSGDGVSTVPASATRSVAAGEERPLIQLNLLRALQLHRRLAVGIALAGLALALAYVAKTWPVYTAVSQLYVQPVQPKVMAPGNEQSGQVNSTAYDSYVQQQVQSGSNPEVLLSALHKLGPGGWQRDGESEQAAVERLGRSIEVARVGTSFEIAITARAKDPESAAKIANAVGASVVERASGEGNAGDPERMAVLREERDRIENAMNADYAEQGALNKQLGMASVGTEAPDLIDADIGKTREELIKAQTDHDEAEARFTAMRAGQANSSAAIDAEADDIVAADAGLTSMKTSLNQRRAVLISQMANLTPSNPEYKQDAAELGKINSNLESMMKELRAKAAARIQQRLRTDLDRTAGVETKLNGQLRQLAGAAASATPKLQRANDLATDIARLRTRYTIVDEQLHNLLVEDSAPGAVHLSVAAVAPLHPTIAGILKKVVPLIFGGLILGLLAASLANHLDKRIYIAKDVEETLGFAPMAVLPNFDEISDEVAAEYLLRLTAAIEHARKQGSLKNCIFTGTAAGSGVTSVVTRVRDTLESMGRATVLLDSSGAAEQAQSTRGHNEAFDDAITQRGSRSTALLQRVAAETEMREERLVLTDTAPLLISAETENLARFVDCAIVVIESGVTTRAQLRATADALQRLEVGTVGFVLNRVGLAKADPAFRRSVREIENHLHAQGLSATMRTVRTGKLTDEPKPDKKELPSESVVVAQSPAAPTPQPDAETVARRTTSGVPQWLPDVDVADAPAQKVAAEMDADVPWWMLDARPQLPAKGWQPDGPPESALPTSVWPAEIETEAPPVRSSEKDLIGTDEALFQRTAKAAPIAAETAALEPEPRPVPEESPYVTGSRLSGLRGLLSSIGLKDLNKTRDLGQEDGKTPIMPEGGEDFAAPANGAPPFIEPAPVAASLPKASAPSAPARPVVAEPEFLPPKEFVPIKDRRARAGAAGRNDRQEADDVRILPSRRGQYEKRR